MSFPAANAPLKLASNTKAAPLALVEIPSWPPPMQSRGSTPSELMPSQSCSNTLAMIGTLITNMSVHPRIVPRHQKCGSDATVNAAVMPGLMNQVHTASCTQTLLPKGNLEYYCLSTCHQNLHMCSLEHITTFNPQLAGCRGLLTVPCTVILTMV